MSVMKDKSILREHLINTLNEIRHDKKKVVKIKKGMKDEYKFLVGTVQLYINNPERHVSELNDNELYSLAEQTFKINPTTFIDPTQYFTKREIKEVQTNFEIEVKESINFPYTFKYKFVEITDGDWIGKTDAQELNMLLENQLLQWNEKTQREGRQSVDKETGNIITKPKIIEKSVKKIEDLLEKGQAASTTITFNARYGSSDDDAGEVLFNKDEGTLTVTEGSLLDILDGFHRLNGISRAFRKNNDVNKEFKLNVLNFDIGRAQEHFAQLNTTNPVSKGHVNKMRKEKPSDKIVQYLQSNSELKNKVTTSHMVAQSTPLLVTYSVISDAIDITFEINNRSTEIQVSKSLTSYINELFYSYPDAFLDNIVEVRNESTINTNAMFYGHITLFGRFIELDIPVEKLKDVYDTIDWSRSNSLWNDIGLLDEKNYVNLNSSKKKKLIKYFNDLDLTPYIEKEGALK